MTRRLLRMSSVSVRMNTAPTSSIHLMAERSATLRVFGVATSSSARSHACATSMLKFQALGRVALTLSFIAGHGLIVNVFTEINTARKRGRPPGRTAEGEATRLRLYEAAVALISERGYEAATLRDVANRARVSPALLYRYFPNKRSVVLALYDQLSETFARQAAGMPRGKWRERFVFALELSLRVLGRYRVTLRALAPVMVGDADEGVFAHNTAFSRTRVQSIFQEAVVS